MQNLRHHIPSQYDKCHLPPQAAHSDRNTRYQGGCHFHPDYLNEADLAEYARKKGLYVEQIKAWRDACMNANGGIAKEAARLNQELKDSQKERKKLEKELQRKDKALAEAAALLVLTKKANAIWGDPEDGK